MATMQSHEGRDQGFADALASAIRPPKDTDSPGDTQFLKAVANRSKGKCPMSGKSKAKSSDVTSENNSTLDDPTNEELESPLAQTDTTSDPTADTQQNEDRSPTWDLSGNAAGGNHNNNASERSHNQADPRSGQDPRLQPSSGYTQNMGMQTQWPNWYGFPTQFFPWNGPNQAFQGLPGGFPGFPHPSWQPESNGFTPFQSQSQHGSPNTSPFLQQGAAPRQDQPLSTSSAQSQSDLAAPLDEAADPDYASDASKETHHSEMTQDEEPKRFSPQEALAKLRALKPAYFAPDEEDAQDSDSAAASAEVLRLSSSAPASRSCIKETPMVSAAMKNALSSARGSKDRFSQGSIPNFPEALPCGKFLRADRFPTGGRGPSNRYFAHSHIPSATLSLSQEDLLLTGGSSSTKPETTIPLKAFADNEEIARRALESCSIIDSFLGGLFTAISDPNADHFQLSQEADPETILSFATMINDTLKFVSGSLAKLHVNNVLVRRDAILTRSSAVKSHQTRSSLRHVPPIAGSLFSGSVQPTIKHQAEVRRDLAFSQPARPNPAPRPFKRPYNRPQSGPAPKQARPSRPQQGRPQPKKRPPIRRPAYQTGGAARRPHPQ